MLAKIYNTSSDVAPLNCLFSEFLLNSKNSEDSDWPLARLWSCFTLSYARLLKVRTFKIPDSTSGFALNNEREDRLDTVNMIERRRQKTMFFEWWNWFWLRNEKNSWQWLFVTVSRGLSDTRTVSVLNDAEWENFKIENVRRGIALFLHSAFCLERMQAQPRGVRATC